MSADTFDRHSAPCPVCHRTSNLSLNMVNGLLTCPHCRSRLVVGFSGHYVRDPFYKRRSGQSTNLRQQSRPWARILRDSGLAKHSPLIAMLSSLLIAGFTLSIVNRPNGQDSQVENWIQQITNAISE